MRPAAPRFLSIAQVEDLHDGVIERYGGLHGTRDHSALLAACAMPCAGHSGGYYHQFPWEMAAAYAYHVASDHPFVDGNKRTGLMCALVFLIVNGWEVRAEAASELEEQMLLIARGRGGKRCLAEVLERWSAPREGM